MATFHAEPNRATPENFMWFSVETPSVFREIRLPACNADWSRTHWRRFRELEALAERFGTHVRRSSYRRG